MSLKEKLPRILITFVVLFPILLMIVVAFLTKVGMVPTMIFIGAYSVPIAFFMMTARDELMFRLQMRFMRRFGYISLEIACDDLRRLRIPAKPENGRITNSGRAWKYRPDYLTFPSGIPTLLVNERDAQPIDLLQREERTLYLDPEDVDKAPVEDFQTGVDAENKPVMGKRKSLRIFDIRALYKPRDYMNDMIEAAQVARILGPNEMKLIFYAAIGAAIVAAAAAALSYQNSQDLKTVLALLKAIPAAAS